jgi:shikimate kinase
MKLENITLIGMPASGKSTYGKLLAKKINFSFIDGDEYIKDSEKMSAQKIIDSMGEKEFLKIEERRILELLPLEKSVLAPGGSVVYSKKLMNTLKNSSLIIFLDEPFEVIEKRLRNQDRRGIVGQKSKSLKGLYDERIPLYKEYADITINCFRKSADKIIGEIIDKIKK